MVSYYIHFKSLRLAFILLNSVEFVSYKLNVTLGSDFPRLLFLGYPCASNILELDKDKDIQVRQLYLVDVNSKKNQESF